MNFGLYWRQFYRSSGLYYVDIDSCMFHKGELKFFLELKEVSKNYLNNSVINVSKTQLYLLKELSQRFNVSSYVGLMHDPETWIPPSRYRLFVKKFQKYFAPAQYPQFRLFKVDNGDLECIGDFDHNSFPNFVINHPSFKEGI